MMKVIEILLSAGTAFTFAAMLIAWAIIGGPMQYMKSRYKLFMFFVAASLMGATLDKLARFAMFADSNIVVAETVQSIQNDRDIAEVLALAKALILLTRILMVGQGLFILVMWHTQCLRVKTAIRDRMANHDHPHRGIKLHNGQTFESSRKTVHFKVDDEIVVSREHELTPNKIMELAGVDPKNHYLVRLCESGEESFRDKAETSIHVNQLHVNQHDKFITLLMGATPVS